MRDRVTSERVIVDVSHVDWSRHPAWGSDFDVDVMLADRDNIPDWAGDVVKHHVEIHHEGFHGSGSAVSYQRAVQRARGDAMDRRQRHLDGTRPPLGGGSTDG